MKAAHTPGPWRLEAYDLEVMDFAVSNTGRMTDYAIYPPLSKKHPMPIASVQHCFNGKACKANAQLIAAAPDLFDALQDLFGSDMECILMRDGKDDQIAAIAKARAAIAKVTGGAA